MSFFSKQKSESLPWVSLTSENQWNDLVDEKNKTTLVFKHSTRCGISSMALRRFESEWDRSQDQYRLIFLDLLQYRSLSTAIERDLNVQHQSPQVIVWRNKEVIYSASHSSINAEKILSLL